MDTKSTSKHANKTNQRSNKQSTSFCFQIKPKIKKVKDMASLFKITLPFWCFHYCFVKCASVCLKCRGSVYVTRSRSYIIFLMIPSD